MVARRHQILFTIDNEIWVMNADGSDQRQLTHDADRVSQNPSWSPDGTMVVFSRCSSPFGFQRCSIDVMNADGTGLTKLIGGDWVSVNPQYSPDGETIAFGSNRGGYVSNVWVMGMTASDPKRLTDPTAGVGTRLVPGRKPHRLRLRSDLPFSSVWVMRADGTDAARTHAPHRRTSGDLRQVLPRRHEDHTGQ